jgi:hypothetical protein
VINAINWVNNRPFVAFYNGDKFYVSEVGKRFELRTCASREVLTMAGEKEIEVVSTSRMRDLQDVAQDWKGRTVYWFHEDGNEDIFVCDVNEYNLHYGVSAMDTSKMPGASINAEALLTASRRLKAISPERLYALWRARPTKVEAILAEQTQEVQDQGEIIIVRRNPFVGQKTEGAAAEEVDLNYIKEAQESAREAWQQAQDALVPLELAFSPHHRGDLEKHRQATQAQRDAERLEREAARDAANAARREEEWLRHNAIQRQQRKEDRQEERLLHFSTRRLTIGGGRRHVEHFAAAVEEEEEGIPEWMEEPVPDVPMELEERTGVVDIRGWFQPASQEDGKPPGVT